MSEPHIPTPMRIGLFGGTFDPPHTGHMLVAKRAMQHLALHQLWFIPSTGNPLKSRQPAPMAERMAILREMARHPRFRLYDLETRFRTRYTVELVAELQDRFPKGEFIFICGADILSEIHRWRDWLALVERVPIAAFARPGEELAAGLSVMAETYGEYRYEASDARLMRDAPAWAIITGSSIDISSSELRAQNGN